MYHRAGSNALQSFVRNPADRMADGIFLGLQHSARTKAIPVTHFKIRVDFYDNVDWPWVTTTAVSGGTFTATMNVPADAPYGMSEAVGGCGKKLQFAEPSVNALRRFVTKNPVDGNLQREAKNQSH